MYLCITGIRFFWAEQSRSSFWWNVSNTPLRWDVCMLSHVQLFVISWTVAHQASLSMGFSRQEYWSRLPFPSPRDLPNPGIKLKSLVSPALGGRFFTTSTTREPTPLCTIPHQIWEAINYKTYQLVYILLRKNNATKTTIDFNCKTAWFSKVKMLKKKKSILESVSQSVSCSVVFDSLRPHRL